MRVGLLGTQGPTTRKWLAAVRHVDGVELAGIWDPHPERVQAAMNKFGTPIYSSLTEFLDSVDALICNAEMQAHHAAPAALAGKHLVLMSPLGTDELTAHEIGEAVRDANVSAIVFLEDFFDPETRAFLDRQRVRRPREAALTWLEPVVTAAGAVGPRGLGWDLGWEVLPRAAAQFEWVLGPIVMRMVTPSVDAARWEVAFRHVQGRSSSVTIDAHYRGATPLRTYDFAHGTQLQRHIASPNLWPSFVAALEELQRAVARGMPENTPWSVETCELNIAMVQQVRSARLIAAS